jgi:hypothetical protein
MAIFQVPDTGLARDRAQALGVRVVWQIALDDISGTHFHPKDVPGAIVSVDTPRPPETWRWGGPDWTGQVPEHDGARIAGITVECENPQRTAAVWGALLDVNPTDTELKLDGGRQSIAFRKTSASSRAEGITEVAITLPGGRRSGEVCGVTLRLVDVR